MPLVKDGRRVDDPWVTVADDDALPEAAPVIVSLARWTAEREALTALGRPLGIRLSSDQRVEDIADLSALDLVALEFPVFRDGRAFSSARLLRQRYGFQGEIRAVGDVLRDQFLFMARCGFDAVEVADEAQADAWCTEMSRFSVAFQSTAHRWESAASLREMRKEAQ